MALKCGVPTNLGEVPQVADHLLYRELLDIHNAIDILSQLIYAEYAPVVPITEHYSPVARIETLLVDTTAAAVTITIPSLFVTGGCKLSIKHIAGGNNLRIQCEDGEEVEGSAYVLLPLLDSGIAVSDGTSIWLL